MVLSQAAAQAFQGPNRAVLGGVIEDYTEAAVAETGRRVGLPKGLTQRIGNEDGIGQRPVGALAALDDLENATATGRRWRRAAAMRKSSVTRKYSWLNRPVSGSVSPASPARHRR